MKIQAIKMHPLLSLKLLSSDTGGRSGSLPRKINHPAVNLPVTLLQYPNPAGYVQPSCQSEVSSQICVCFTL